MKLADKTKFILAGLVISGIAVFLIFYQKTPALSFNPDRKEIYIIKGTFLRSQKLELKVIGGKWFMIEPKFNLPIEIATPYYMRFNAHYEAVLEPHGTLAMISNDHLERSELKWIDGRWKHKDPSTTEWLEFGEPDLPEPAERPR
jgi:hypothetical protein